jgi:hypothetical protein
MTFPYVNYPIFSAGFPIISHFTSLQPSKLGAYGLGGVNASGQVPQISGHFVLVDPDTPQSALHYTSHNDKSTWELVFSDEFNIPNRTFYPGDDAYWEAVDLHYWYVSFQSGPVVVCEYFQLRSVDELNLPSEGQPVILSGMTRVQ